MVQMGWVGLVVHERMGCRPGYNNYLQVQGLQLVDRLSLALQLGRLFV